jgi:4a-hydroxytetrahydrobiopterin dehydratase
MKQFPNLSATTAAEENHGRQQPRYSGVKHSMTMPTPPAQLTDEEVRAALGSLPGWSVQKGKLHCEYAFADFVDADAFLTRASKSIPTLDLHAKSFQSWHRVVIDLTTGAVGGITLQDVEVAAALEALAKQFP